MAGESAAGEQDTLEFLLGRTKRDFIPVRHAFVHDPATGGGVGPLAAFLRRPGTLDLYLLIRGVAVNEPHNVQFPAAVWSRALGRGSGTSGELWVSKALRWLEDQGLITRRRIGRGREITLRHDSLLDEPYTRPVGGKDKPFEWFLKLPHEYFLAGWHKKLSAAGKAVLLIALANRPDFELNQRRGEQWWGVSADTIGKGLHDLRDKGLLSVRTVTRKAPESRTGLTTVPRYTLLTPFAQPDSGGSAKPKGRRKTTRKGSR